MIRVDDEGRPDKKKPPPTLGLFLLQNAVLHGGATHAVIRVERVPGDLIRLVVEDNGTGVSPADLAHLGEPFSRPSTTSGTGMGLHVSRRLVSRMGGAMSFGVAGGGLVVTIELPEAR